MTILTAIIGWLVKRFGVETLKALTNPIVLLLLFGAFGSGSATGWFKARDYYLSATRTAQLQSALAKRNLEYKTLTDASVEMSKQLVAGSAAKQLQDARITEFENRLKSSAAAGDKTCRETLGDDVLKILRPNAEDLPR